MIVSASSAPVFRAFKVPSPRSVLICAMLCMFVVVGDAFKGVQQESAVIDKRSFTILRFPVFSDDIRISNGHAVCSGSETSAENHMHVQGFHFLQHARLVRAKQEMEFPSRTVAKTFSGELGS